MTPPEHFVCGLTTANALYSARVFLGRSPAFYPVILVIGGVAAVLPDIDAFFGHYASTNALVGHRGWTHSLLGIVGFATIFSLGFKLFGKNGSLFIWLCATLAGLSHLLCDLITPPSVWGGLPLLFPLSQRYGGWSLIGWYDLQAFWLLLLFLVPSSAMLCLTNIIRRKGSTNAIRLTVAFAFLTSLTGLAAATWSISNSRYENEAQWYSIQSRDIRQFPAPIPALTNRAMEIFLALFNRLRAR